MGEKRIEQDQVVRAAFDAGSVDVEKRSAEMVWTTGADVLRYDWERGHHYYERLRVDEKSVDLGRLERGAPLLNSHRSYGLEDVIGVVERATVADGKGTAVVRFSKRADVEPIFRDVADGIIRNVSVGYRPLRIEETNEARDGVPVREVTRWEPRELSLVPIGADAGAQVRAEDIRLPAPGGAANPQVNMEENKTQERAATTAPANINTQPAVDEAKVRAEAIAAERARGAGIRDAVRKAGLDVAFADGLIERGVSVDEARAAVIDKLAEKGKQEISTVTAGDSSVRDAQFRKVTEDGLAMRCGLAKREGEAAHYSNLSLMRLGEEILRQQGRSVRGMNDLQMARAIIETGDFAAIVAAVGGRSLRQAYEEYPQTFKRMFRRALVSNFRPVERVKLGSAPGFDAIPEGTAYPEKTLADGKETYTVGKYGAVIHLTMEAIVNDDLDALTRVPQMHGKAAARKESDVVWTSLFLANPNMTDTNPVFGAARGNYINGVAGAALSVASLETGAAAIMAQTGDASEKLDLYPRFLVVGPAQQFAAERFLKDPVSTDSANNLVPSLRSLELIVEPRFTGNQWALACPTEQIDTVEYAYINGMEGVYTEQEPAFTTDSVQYKGRLIFGAGFIDYRGLYFSTGVTA